MTKKIKLSDEELLELLSVECNSFSDIALTAGVTRERIRQLYVRKFKRLLGTRKTGHQRHKVCTRKRVAIQKELLRPVGNAAEAAKLAELYGLRTKGNLRQGYTTVIACKKTFLANDHLVHVLKSSVAHSSSPRSARPKYYRVRGSVVVKEADFLCVLLPNTCLVIPSAVLPLNKSIYIRDDKEYKNTPITYPRFEPYVDWWNYENAWDLIAPAESIAAKSKKV